MDSLLEHPAVMAGLLPLTAALVPAALLSRTRFAWLAVACAHAAMVAMTTGISFFPFSASRKVLLLVLAAPLLGIAIDLWRPGSRTVRFVLALLAAASVGWVFGGVLGQRELPQALMAGGAVALVVALVTGLTLRLSADGPAAGAAGVGLGIAVGVAALLSASSGYFYSGIALAAACGGLQLVQFVTRRALVPGFTGAFGIGIAAALFAAASALLAQLPWHGLAAMVLPPLLAGLPVASAAPVRTRVVARSALAVAGALIPITAAWLAATSGAG